MLRTVDNGEPLGLERFPSKSINTTGCFRKKYYNFSLLNRNLTISGFWLIQIKNGMKVVWYLHFAPA